MTDHDNLRDRIAAQITPFLYWNYADWEDAGERDKADARECAQAIIDELRLEREVSPINVDCVRYVSKWELRKH